MTSAGEVRTEDACGGRAVRADARRNRERILEAAHAVFASRGVSVPIDDVAREAGVGVGTLYRHFPTKEALFEAVVIGRLEQMVAAAEAAATAEDPGGAFFDYLGVLTRQIVEKRDLGDALEQAGVDLQATVAPITARLQDALETLLENAQRAGAVRNDVSATELVGLVLGTCKVRARLGTAAPDPDRMLAVVCDGLRATPA
ncbi:MAG TPA: TetR family transcriptional regulator [Acidimicrobiales bacterium]|nr:TetR family transcriptional regulator [Acidimicrobiales bacterium]